MSQAREQLQVERPPAVGTAELMILPDGRILAHNLTPELAAVLARLDPTDAAMNRRAGPAPARTPAEISTISP